MSILSHHDEFDNYYPLTKNNQGSNKGELERIVRDEVIEPIKNGELVVKKERPQGEWIITGEEQGALGIIYKIRKCDKCGWEHSLIIPNNFCPKCGADMRGGQG